MKKAIRVLLIDDHPFSLEGYKLVLNELHSKQKINQYYTDEAYCCETALNYIKNKSYDLVILDISLPPSEDGLFQSGLDLGRLLTKKNPITKIIVITSHNDPLLLNNILYTLSPKGFLYRGDINARILSDSIVSILNNNTYFSTLILNLIHKNLSSNIILDAKDKQILYELSKGVKTIDLKNVIPLSQAGIEKRKRLLKETFKTKQLDDTALIKAAIETGFL
ncbi:MAG: response regulator [Xanthomarina gelatinilytica]|uniref:response regulator n=1 Tax=Xanthomarina gelatinilytica TaxID=1137281 RepID=UPI003A85B1FD